jgi:DNA-binding transcriptional LysR family regulator
MSLLVASVETGSFSAAGRKLGMPLPTVSRKIADLEARLKTRLLVRSTRKLSLTDAGAAYVASCKHILELVDEAEAQASGEYSVPRGELTLSAPVVFGRLHVLPVVNDFLADFSEINVRMMLTDRNVNLIEEHIDMAVRVGDLPDSTMMATTVGSIRRVVIAGPAYLAAHGRPKTPGDLVEKHMCVSFSVLAAGAAWTFAQSGGQGKSVRPNARLSVNTAEAAIDAAIAGVGLTNVLSYQVAQHVREGKLKIVLQNYEPPPIPVHILHAGQGPLPLKMRRFLEFAAPRLRKSLANHQAFLAGRK